MSSPHPRVVHQNILDRFSRLRANGRLAHAYLFIGPRGIGKSETALALAQQVNCLEQGAADCVCASCRKVVTLNHPDVWVIEKPEDKTEILIGQFVERPNSPYAPLLPRLALRPFEGRYKVVIIREADRMNDEAANAFLKCLEEPPAATIIILTTAAPARLLPTIVSRCQPVHFFPLGNTELADQVRNEYHVGSVEANVLARLGQGSSGQARKRGPEFLKLKNEMIDRFVFSRDVEAAVKAYCADRDSAREFLEVLLTFFRDVALARRGTGADLLVHGDRVKEVQTLAARYSEDDIDQIIAQTVSAIRGVGELMNVKVAVTLLKEMI